VQERCWIFLFNIYVCNWHNFPFYSIVPNMSKFQCNCIHQRDISVQFIYVQVWQSDMVVTLCNSSTHISSTVQTFAANDPWHNPTIKTSILSKWGHGMGFLFSFHQSWDWGLGAGAHIHFGAVMLCGLQLSQILQFWHTCETWLHKK
jgi:hypothetical protein